MAELSIQDAIPTDSPMIVMGTGANLAVNAMVAAGQLNTSTILVNAVDGKPSPAQNAVDIQNRPDPSLKLEIAPNDPRMRASMGAPEFNGGPRR